MKKTRARGIDLIRDGVSKEDLRRAGSRAVFSALVSTAMSWQNRGWSFDMWVSTLREPQSLLGRQVQLDHRRMARTANAVAADLRSAWEKAEVNVAERPTLTRNDIRATARKRLEQLDSLEKDAWPLDDRALLVLRHVLETAADLGSTKPAIPVRDAMKAARLPSTMAAHRALRRLEAEDLIRCVERGRPGRGRSSGRASLFAWETPGLGLLLKGTSQCPYGAMSNAEQERPLDMSNGDLPPVRNTLQDMSNSKPISTQTDALDMSNAKTKENTMEPITIRLDGGEVVTVTIPDGKEARDQVLSMLKAAGAEIETDHNADAPIVPLRLAN